MKDNQLDVGKSLRDLDNLQIELNPLPQHYVAQLDENIQELYFSTLLSLILAGGQVTESQTRLLKLLINAMTLKDDLEKYWHQASEITSEQLREFCHITETHNLAHSFFMDVLVICRLNEGLTQEQAQMLSEFVALLHLPESDLPTIIHLANRVLGLTVGNWPSVSFDCDKLDVWSDYLFRILTVDALRNGNLTGSWLVNKILNIDFPVGFNDADVFFTVDGLIDINFNEYLNINKSRLWHANIKITTAKLNITKSTLHSPMLNASQSSELNLLGTTIIGQNNIGNNASISIKKVNKISINDCIFKNCGSISTLMGGALYIDSSLFSISNSTFEHCIARHGGGIYLSNISINSFINDCEFLNCDSGTETWDWNKVNWKTFAESGGAIYATGIIKGEKPLINSSKFFKSSICIKSLKDYYKCNVHLVNTNLTDSPIFYEENTCNALSFECGFSNGGLPDSFKQ